MRWTIFHLSNKIDRHIQSKHGRRRKSMYIFDLLMEKIKEVKEINESPVAYVLKMVTPDKLMPLICELYDLNKQHEIPHMSFASI